jgi:hypothetical protein
MIGAWPVAWLLTAVFAASALGSLPRRRRSGAGVADGISAAFHLLMCLALMVMTWRSEPLLPVWLQTAAFGCAVIWFGLAAPARTADVPARSLSGWHHAVMAGAMIWMIMVTPAAMRTPSAGGMSAMSRPAIPNAVAVISALLGAYCGLAAAAWLARATDRGLRIRDRRAASQAAMSVGMAALLVAML